jgi:hypothetical protein
MPLRGLSRMLGNSQVRFLGECGAVMRHPYPTVWNGHTAQFAPCIASRETRLNPQFVAAQSIAHSSVLTGSFAILYIASPFRQVESDKMGYSWLSQLFGKHPPPSAPPDIAPARTLLEQGRARDAESCARTLLLCDKGSIEALCILSSALTLQCRFAEAEQVIRAALNIEPQHPDALVGLAHTLLFRGIYGELCGWRRDTWRQVFYFARLDHFQNLANQIASSALRK